MLNVTEEGVFGLYVLTMRTLLVELLFAFRPANKVALGVSAANLVSDKHWLYEIADLQLIGCDDLEFR